MTAVVGPLATYAEPHAYDLCDPHSERLSAPRGWEVLRLAHDDEQGPSSDDLLALADAVREAAQPRPVEQPLRPGPPGRGCPPRSPDVRPHRGLTAAPTRSIDRVGAWRPVTPRPWPPPSRRTTSAAPCPTRSTRTWRAGSATRSSPSPERTPSSSVTTCGPRRRACHGPSPRARPIAGADVVLIGLASTDQLYFASGRLERPGAMFTASHNPARYNGIKMCRAFAAPIGMETGLAEIRDRVASGETTTAPSSGHDHRAGRAGRLRGVPARAGAGHRPPPQGGRRRRQRHGRPDGAGGARSDRRRRRASSSSSSTAPSPTTRPTRSSRPTWSTSRPRCSRPAPTSAWPSTATPTGASWSTSAASWSARACSPR